MGDVSSGMLQRFVQGCACMRMMQRAEELLFWES